MKLDILDRDYDGYLFDCDGTLIDSMPLHYEGWVFALGEIGVDFVFPRPLYNALSGTATHEIVRLLNERFQVDLDPESLMRHKREYYLRSLDRLERIEPVCEFAERIAATHPVAIVTGGHRDIVAQSLRATALLDLFPVIVTHQDVPNGKPAPDMFLLAAEALRVEPSRCLVFEDGQLGIQGAQAAGMDTVLVPTPPTAEPSQGDAQQ